MHWHRYGVLDIRHVEDVSFGTPGIKRTEMLLICKLCGKAKTRRIDGFWSVEQLRGFGG